MFAHGLMFHHFYDETHPRGQGAISGDEFARILDYYEGRIVSASEWLKLYADGSLSPSAVCLTFDDALKCQIDVALPILRDRNLTAFWFVYSSVFEGNIEALELFRYFRTVKFDCFEQFCQVFMKTSEGKFAGEIEAGLRGVAIENYLAEFPFYSRSDRLYRYIRDRVLSKGQHDEILQLMMVDASLDINDARENLWMTDSDLSSLVSTGHIAGLHSYTHPIRIQELTATEQYAEYDKNFRHLTATTGAEPISMSHPCNSYDATTLDILESMGVKIGFCSNMSQGPARSRFEIPREDHANIMTRLR